FPTFLGKNRAPEFGRLALEDQFEGSRVREPCLPFHFFFELARTPAGIAGKHFYFARSGERFAQLNQRIERVTESQIRDHVGVGNKSVRVEKTQRGGLDWTAQIKRATLEGIREIGDDDFTNVT